MCQPRCFLSSSTRRPDRRPGAPLPRTLRAFANEARVPRGRASPIAEPIPSPQGPSRIVLVGRLGHTWGMLQGATADNPGHSRTRRPPGPPGRTLPARTQLGGMPSMACKRSIAIPLLGRAVRMPTHRAAPRFEDPDSMNHTLTAIATPRPISADLDSPPPLARQMRAIRPLRYVPVTGRLGTFLPISPLDLDLIGKRNRVRVTNRLECSV